MGFQKTWIVLPAVLATLLWAPLASAGDFDWTRDFNVRAEADPSGFRARLAARFKIGDAEIDAVIGNTESPADAYVVLRLGEMSSRSSKYVMERHRSEKGEGWGALAKSLGIKPGSREFHALKRGDDLYGGNGKDRIPRARSESPNNSGRGKGK